MEPPQIMRKVNAILCLKPKTFSFGEINETYRNVPLPRGVMVVSEGLLGIHRSLKMEVFCHSYCY